jgi:hypothetical protein
VGSKLDLAKDRAVKPKDLEFPKNKGLPYLEMSSKANYKTKELLLGLVRSLLGYVDLFRDSVAKFELIYYR